MGEHEIRRAQAVTRWVESVKETAKHRTRDGSLKNNRRDSEYVSEHIQAQADRIEQLEAIVERLDWHLRDLCYRSPEVLPGHVQAMVDELHPQNREAAQAAREQEGGG